LASTRAEEVPTFREERGGGGPKSGTLRAEQGKRGEIAHQAATGKEERSSRGQVGRVGTCLSVIGGKRFREGKKEKTAIRPRGGQKKGENRGSAAVIRAMHPGKKN